MNKDERTAFGHWLSGFVDGEGCFCLSVRNQCLSKANDTPAAKFLITLREDDVPVLRSIAEFLGIGRIVRQLPGPNAIKNSKPAARFVVQRISDLVNVVVPHFERFPLRAKKANEFEIWKRGIMVLSRTILDGQTTRGTTRMRSGRRKWTDSDLIEFRSIAADLSALRTYREVTWSPE